jgi:hypothetical protein
VATARGSAAQPEPRPGAAPPAGGLAGPEATGRGLAGRGLADGPPIVMTTIGSPGEERLRLAQTTGAAPTGGFLLRTPSVLAPSAPRAGAVVVRGVLPELLVVRNSALPTFGNDGALWAGRGTSVLARGGLAVRAGRFAAVLAPEVATAQNRGFQSSPTGLEGQRPATGPFAAPWFVGPYSADLPIRFGDQSYTVFAPGQSHATVDVGPLAAGVSTENQWWGPGVRNALVLSNAGEGVVHAFVRTGRPLRTRIGDVEARWIVGGLTPSLFFDQPDDTPAGRALSGAVATLRLRAEPDLTVGVARLVLTPTRGAVLGRAFDVFHRNQPLGADQALPDRRRVDQLMSVFARWVFPGAGAEAYGEFARLELPRSFREFLVAPMNTGAYTLGAARAYRPRAGHAVRVNLELTNLEQSRTFTDRPPPPDFYTGRAAPGGFTNRGQVLGAAIGPRVPEPVGVGGLLRARVAGGRVRAARAAPERRTVPPLPPDLPPSRRLARRGPPRRRAPSRRRCPRHTRRGRPAELPLPERPEQRRSHRHRRRPQRHARPAPRAGAARALTRRSGPAQPTPSPRLTRTPEGSRKKIRFPLTLGGSHSYCGCTPTPRTTAAGSPAAR